MLISDITVGHAGGTVQKYKQKLHARISLGSQMEMLRNAAAVLMKDMGCVKNEDTYPSPHNIAFYKN